MERKSHCDGKKNESERRGDAIDVSALISRRSNRLSASPLERLLVAFMRRFMLSYVFQQIDLSISVNNLRLKFQINPLPGETRE
jgi:hypothetical protein